MNIVKYAAVGLVALMLGVIIGTSGGVEDSIEAGLATDTPEPTATLEPTPEPTPIIVTETKTVEVEVVPEVCTEALWAADKVIADNADWILSVLEAYTDYPDEDLVDFGRRFEAIVAEGRTGEQEALWDDYVSLADQCHDF